MTNTIYTLNLTDMKWDCLIILDACRYDFFKKVYKDFLKGILSKAYSSGTKTSDFLKKTFRRYYNNIIYISANPIVNSRMPMWGFNARKYFYKVIDVWNWGWDEEFSTVPPWEVNKAVLEVSRRYPGKRLILHYMQPHGPYIPVKCVNERYKVESALVIVGLKSMFELSNPRISDVSTEKIYHFLLQKLKFFIPKWMPRHRLVWELRKLLNVPPLNPEELILRTFKPKTIQILYELNLRFVLKYVSHLVAKLPSNYKIVITADHGELLGERGEFGHTASDLPFKYEMKLREVPWLENIEVNTQSKIPWFGENITHQEFVNCFESMEKVVTRKAIEKKVRQLKRRLNLGKYS